MKKTIIEIQNYYQHYDWGTFEAIPDLLKIKKPETNLPLAELWVGAHPKLPSTVIDSQQGLDQLIAASPQDILGETVAKTAGSLPYLFKILSAKQALSIQVHPNKSQAEQGFNAERAAGISTDAANCNYKDNNHKPELIYAMTDFVAMAGFKTPAEIATSLAKLELAEFSVWVDKLAVGGEAELKDFYTWLLYLPQGELTSICDKSIKVAANSQDFELFWLNQLFNLYGADSGIFFPLVLNLIQLKPGQAIFLGAGCPHAYLQGTGIEIMANSDNVLRGGLTSKYMDREELIKITQYNQAANQVNIQTGQQTDNVLSFDIPVADFQFDLIELTDKYSYQAGQSGKVELYFVIDGECIANGQVFTNAMSFILPANSANIELNGRAKVARVYTQF
ncbi:mannose-6-phosphate isomerase, class I [Catenovulum sp. 2E275]|uniref:mannose-6-phosphate isomerase, class I n=1 Tax=Catenovulum sp. 2E275 TaxID=2980497 RepID=UPI0021CF3B13|nr:mannose-6-phosphate isomerase, class I [Catenovulum sp. 2E275]MCU4675956.1 mannose-6-phosphate isomerase, class I [Catenovulum sp. 2E275]